MPNIELHGFFEEEASALKARIQTSFRRKSWESDYVINVFKNHVTDFCANSQPFIRLVSTDHAHNAEIIEILRSLDVDVEYQALVAFYPKK